MFGSYSAIAASPLVTTCKEDLKKYKCSAKTDAQAHECLEKNEKEGQPDEGFTHTFYEAHEAYEKKMSKKEKNEEHKKNEKEEHSS